MTRRIVKPQFNQLWGQGVCIGDDFYSIHVDIKDSNGVWKWIKCPYGKVGDRLWVRETFYNDIQGGSSDIDHVYYPADAKSKDWCCELIPECCCCEAGKPKLTPSILMPRWASRINLEITGIKVERLQDISGDDAKAEGVKPVPFYNGTVEAIWEPTYGVKGSDSYTAAFQSLWQSINGPDSWDENPWVWCVSFKRVKVTRMPLTSEQKRQRRIDRTHEQLKALTIGSVFNKHPSGLACLFQRLVRLANADDTGMCECISCGVRQPWNMMDSGHFVSRNNKATILEPSNVNPQCKSCNQHKSGNTAEYRKRLVEKVGLAEVERLEKMQLPKNHCWNRYELAIVKVDLLDEIKAHERRLGICKTAT